MIINKIDKGIATALQKIKDRNVKREMYFGILQNKSKLEDTTEDYYPVLDSDETM